MKTVVWILIICGLSCIALGAGQERHPRATDGNSDENKPVGDPDDLIAYRIRLESVDTDTSLVLMNMTKESGRVLYQKVISSAEAKTQQDVFKSLSGGESLSLSAKELEWSNVDFIYVLASRRVRVRLLLGGSLKNIVVPQVHHGSLCDLVSEGRLEEIPTDEYVNRSIVVLSDSPLWGDAVVVRTHELPGVVKNEHFGKRQPSGVLRIFAIIPQ